MAEDVFTESEVVEIRASAYRMWLAVVYDGFYTVKPEVLVKILNGVGPDVWPRWVRVVLDKILRRSREAIAIHDWEFQMSDGRPETLKQVTGNMASNLETSRNLKFPGGSVSDRFNRGYAKLGDAAVMAVLSRFSDEAWKSAHERLAPKAKSLCTNIL